MAVTILGYTFSMACKFFGVSFSRRCINFGVRFQTSNGTPPVIRLLRLPPEVESFSGVETEKLLFVEVEAICFDVSLKNL